MKGIVLIFIILTLDPHYMGCHTVDHVMEAMLKRILELEERVQIMENKADKKENKYSIDDIYDAVVHGVMRVVQRIESKVDSNTFNLQKIGNRLTTVETSIQDQGSQLKDQGQILMKQGETLKSQGMSLNKQGDALNRQGVTLLKLDGDLRDQKIILKNQGLTLSKQEEDLNRQGDTLKKLQEDLMEQGTTLKSQDKTLCKQRKTLENQSSSLKAIEEELSRQNLLLKSQNTTISEQKEILNDQNKNTKKQGVMLKNQTILLQKQDVILHQQAETLTKMDRTMSTLESTVNKNFKDLTQIVTTVKVVLTAVPPGKTPMTPANSCSSLNKHHYNLNDGNYWIRKHGITSFEYCKMDEAGIPLPSASSCKELKKRTPDLKSGTYNITVGGKTFPVICDMETDEGGWLMVGKAVVNYEEEVKQVHWQTIRRDDYTKLRNVTSGRFLLSTIGLNLLYSVSHFNEVRFYCKKSYHGRRVDLKTNGSDVLQWLMHRKSSSQKPPSCGTWLWLPGDTSFIGANCTRWTDDTWWRNEIYWTPMFAKDEKLWYTISLYYDSHWYDDKVFCDNYSGHHHHFSNVGEWGYFVR